MPEDTYHAVCRSSHDNRPVVGFGEARRPPLLLIVEPNSVCCRLCKGHALLVSHISIMHAAKQLSNTFAPILLQLSYSQMQAY